MRFVVFGAGAIGGVVGARLHQSGHEVALIARGAHLQAIRRSGLTLETPVERTVLALTAVEDPGELGPGGADERCQAIAEALSDSRLASQVQTEIMRLKYAKLILNLGNVVEALCGRGEQADELIEQARAEGRAALSAAGIAFEADEVTD